MPRYASIIQQQHMYLKLKAAKLHFSMNRSPFSLKWGFALKAKKEAHWKKGTLLKVHFVAQSFKHLDTTDANGSSLVFFLSSSAWDFVAWKARGCFLSLLPKALHIVLPIEISWGHPGGQTEMGASITTNGAKLANPLCQMIRIIKNTSFTRYFMCFVLFYLDIVVY